jgi:hypothetical protein
MGTVLIDLVQSPAPSSVFTSQANASPSKVSVPSRKQRNQPSGRVHDIEFATEISTSLLAQVRQLQALLAEREEALKTANLENSRLELEAEGFSQRIRTLDESEQRYKDENWSLETQMHELIASVKDAQERETKLNNNLGTLTSEKNKFERELEELKQANSKLLEDQAAAQKAHDSEAHMLRRNLNSGDAERVTLQAKLEELASQNVELARAVGSLRGRHLEAETPRPLTIDTEEAMRDQSTPENSPPPSPNKQTPRHGHLETETLRSSLGHAHRMIQNLKSNIHREKTEKIELKRMLQEARDELETRRRDPNGPGSGAKRQKIKPDTFKKPLPRSDLLGPGRRGRTEIALDEPDWEDHASEASPTRTIRSKKAHSRSPGRATDLSDVYQTANETEDAFETANERETATESEAFQTGAESLAEDSNDEMTETEDRGTPQQGTLRGRRVPSQLAMAKAGDRTSYMSTASTSESEIEQAQTPVQAQPPRYRLKMNRGALRRIRASGEAPMASSVHETSSANDSPAGSFAQESSMPLGQSLFAELEELGSPVTDGEFGTPVRSTHGFSQPNTPLQNSVVLDRDVSVAPMPLPKPAMVDTATMTEVWEQSLPVPAPVPEARPETRHSNAIPVLVDSSTQYTPTKSSSGSNGEQLSTFPTPPKTIWDESAAIRDGQVLVKGSQTPVKVQIDMSSIKAEGTAPVPLIIPELEVSTISSQSTEPVAFKLPQPQPEPVVIPAEVSKAAPAQLSLSAVYSENTQPVAFKVPEPLPVALIEPHIPKAVSPPLSVSSIYAVQTEPVDLPLEEKSPKSSAELTLSSIHSTATIPVEPSWLIQAPAGAFAVLDESPERPSTAVHRGYRGLGPNKNPSAILVSEDETSQPAREVSENESPETNLPLGAISGNVASRDAKKTDRQNSDQGAQTILSSNQIDQLLMHSATTRPFTPAETRSMSDADPAVNSPGATPKAKTPILGVGTIPTLHPIPRRPGSAGSMRTVSAGGHHPPLPADHKQVIAAAQNAQGTPGIGIMGPPLAPASAYKNTVRPWTPNDNGMHSSTARIRSRRESQTSTRRSSLSSFASEINVRFSTLSDGMPQGIGPGTDPRIIQAITQTMIGEYLWKYTRKAVSGEMSSTRHRRYFWVHPYTRTLYWSEHDPSAGGKNEHKAKSVPIEAVRVITDDNPYPPGLHRKSLEVLTPGRRIRFTASTSQRHETWFNALSYLLLRTGDEPHADDHDLTAEDVEEFNPGFRSSSRQTNPRMSLSSFRSAASNTSKTRATSSLSIRPAVTPGRVSPVPGTQQNSTVRGSDGRPSASSRLSSVFTATIRGSFASRRGRHTPVPVDSIYDDNPEHNSAEDLRQVIERQEREADRLENVRACCDGKFSVFRILTVAHLLFR